MLELKNVTKTFNLTGAKEDLRIALDNVSLQIEPGEFVTIIGSNGSGKSTTMNIVSGTLKPDRGLVLLNNVDITKLNEYQRAPYFGRVFQDPMMGTAGDMSVLENLEVAYLRGRTHLPFIWGFKKADKEYFVQELKRFGLGLETRLNQKVMNMSGGQRQALTLLMATIRQRPSLKKMRSDYIKFANLEDYDFEGVSSYSVFHRDIIHKYDKILYEAKLEYKNKKKNNELTPDYVASYKARRKDLLANFKFELKELKERNKKAKAERKRIEKLAANNFDTSLEKVKAELATKSNEIKNLDTSNTNKKAKIKEVKTKLFNEFAAKFDLTKQILLLDEHTAALDPKTAKKVLELTDKIVRENHMTTLMVTHNMKDALAHGDRLIMFHGGHIILDVRGEEKKKLTVNDLLELFDEEDAKEVN